MIKGIIMRTLMLFLVFLSNTLASKREEKDRKNFIFFLSPPPIRYFGQYSLVFIKIWTYCLPLLALVLFACGQEEPGASDSHTNLVLPGYQVNLTFPDDIPRIGETSDIDCNEAGIATISLYFILNGWQQGPYEFDCKEHYALIPDVPAGTGIRVEVFADDINGNTLLEGSEVIDIPKEGVVTGGKIQMQHASPKPTTETETQTETETETQTETQTETETEVEHFSGIWIITDRPQGCAPFVGISDYTSEIVQTGEEATITTTTALWTTQIHVSCTVSGNELSCPFFEFEDDAERIHSYTEFNLRYTDSDTLIGNNSWTIYSNSGGQVCSGTSTLSGIRAEATGATEESSGLIIELDY